MICNTDLKRIKSKILFVIVRFRFQRIYQKFLNNRPFHKMLDRINMGGGFILKEGDGVLNIFVILVLDIDQREYTDHKIDADDKNQQRNK